MHPFQAHMVPYVVFYRTYGIAYVSHSSPNMLLDGYHNTVIQNSTAHQLNEVTDVLYIIGVIITTSGCSQTCVRKLKTEDEKDFDFFLGDDAAKSTISMTLLRALY